MKRITFLLFFFTVLLARFTSAQDTSGLAIPQQKFEKQMKKKNTSVLDVRTPEEYKSGYIGHADRKSVV